MRLLIPVLSVGLMVAGALPQGSIVSPLKEGVDQLKAAQQLHVTYTAQVLGSAATDVEITLAKPDWFKVETPDETIIGDGKKIVDYKVADKSYTEVESTPAALKAIWQRPELWGWSAFFDEKFGADVSTRAGAARTIKGKSVATVDGGKEKLGEFTFFVDAARKSIQGYSKKDGDKQFLVIASEVEIMDEPGDAAKFAFVPPAGAKKVEQVAVSATYKEVQAIFDQSCMPCHEGGANPSGGVDLSTYKGVSAAVTPGAAATSLIVKALRGKGAKQMPPRKGPLPEAKIAAVEAWINAGAKAE